MADKPISALPRANMITSADLFVLEQNNEAKSLDGQTLVSFLTALADGHGGIQSVTKTSTAGLVDTYTITFADASTYQYQVTNGEKGDTGAQTYVHFKWSSVANPSSSDMGDIPDDYIGVYTGTSASAPATPASYKWYLYKGKTGDKGDNAVITHRDVAYQASDSGTDVPTGSWKSAIPVLSQGQYLWTRTTIAFNSGDPVVAYSVSYKGLDGSGAVSAWNSLNPDKSSNITASASDLPASDGRDVQAHLTELEAEGSVTSAKLANGSVVESKLAAGSVTSAKIADQSVTPAKLDRAYATLTDGKVAANQATSAIVFASQNLTISEGHAGKFVRCDTADITITIPADLPWGMEFEVCRYGTNTVTFAAGEGVTIVSVDNTKSIASRYGVAVAKQIGTNMWLLSGGLE